MTTAELIEEVAEATKLPKSYVGTILTNSIHTISEALRRGEPVKLTRLGVFDTRPIHRKICFGKQVRRTAAVRFRARRGLV